MGTLHKDGITSALIQGIEGGELKTISEWAEKFSVSYHRVSRALSCLRKKGFNFHPNPMPMRVGMRTKKGIVVNIMEKEEWLRNGMNTYEKNHTMPSLTGMFRMIEAAIENNILTASDVQPYLDHIQTKVIESRERVKGQHSLTFANKVSIKQ